MHKAIPSSARPVAIIFLLTLGVVASAAAQETISSQAAMPATSSTGMPVPTNSGEHSQRTSSGVETTMTF